MSDIRIQRKWLDVVRGQGLSVSTESKIGNLEPQFSYLYREDLHSVTLRAEFMLKE